MQWVAGSFCTTVVVVAQTILSDVKKQDLPDILFEKLAIIFNMEIKLAYPFIVSNYTL